MREQHPQWRKVMAALALCVLLSTCGDSEQAKKPTEPSETRKRETDLMSDPNRAGPELDKQLAESAPTGSHEYVLVRASGFYSVDAPLHRWHVDCVWQFHNG